MKLSQSTYAIAGVLLASSCTAPFAEEKSPLEASGNVLLTTDYVFRGISQTDNRVAIQGGLDLSYALNDAISAYVGTWASNVAFAGSIENDVYGGFSGNVLGIDWDLGGLGYIYPGDHDLDYAEVYGSLGYGFSEVPLEPAVKIGLNYSPDNFAKTNDAYYLYGNLDLTLPYEVTFSAHGARQWVKDNFTFGTPDYWDWSLSLSKNVIGFDVSVGYYDTDIKDSECFGGDSVCDSRVVVSVGRSL